MYCWNFIAHLRLVGLICWILRNRVVTSQLLMFKGKFIHVKAGGYLMLTCSSTDVPAYCTMEFLHNNATVEVLKMFEKRCYSTGRLCDPDVCSCNKEDCKSYSWNLTTKSVKKDDSFGCGMRVENTNNNSKVYLTLKYNGTDFNSPTTIIVQGNKVSTTLHYTQTTSATKKGDANSDLIQEGPDCWTLMMLWCLFGFACSVLLGFVFRCVRVKLCNLQISSNRLNCNKAVMNVIVLSLSVTLFALPLIVGKIEEEHCFAPAAFAVYGAAVGTVSCYLLIEEVQPSQEESSTEPPSQSGTDQNAEIQEKTAMISSTTRF